MVVAEFGGQGAARRHGGRSALAVGAAERRTTAHRASEQRGSAARTGTAPSPCRVKVAGVRSATVAEHPQRSSNGTKQRGVVRRVELAGVTGGGDARSPQRLVGKQAAQARDAALIQ